MGDHRRKEDALDQRRDSDALIAQLRYEVDSLRRTVTWPGRKNGETWQRYLGKFFTPDRLMLMALVIYNFGGQVRDFQTRVVTIERSDADIRKQHDELIGDLRNIAGHLAMQDASLAGVQQRTESVSTRLTAVEERIRLTPTRREHNEVRDLVQIINKRLEQWR